jgi:glycosyltransferase involved in cell wall biosynthesis
LKINKISKIVIITNSPFPNGLAPTNRILSYGKGFLCNGYQPEVICIRPTDQYANSLNNEASGIYEGIKYSYPGRITIRVKSFWGRRLNDIIAVISSLILFLSLLRRKKISFSIFYGNDIAAEVLFILISRLFGKNIYKEESENPTIYFGNSKSILNTCRKRFYINNIYGLYHGLLVMTNPLTDFFMSKSIPQKKLLLVPQTVDHMLFNQNVQSSKKYSNNIYVAYIGSLNQQKDGVQTLVESFTIVLSKYPQLDLLIAGEGSIQEKIDLTLLIEKLQLQHNIHYIGQIAHKEIPFFLQGAKILVSCRPKSLQSDFGFPTKIVEYLASGIPIVTTATGDLKYYLKDKVNAFIADYAEPVAFGLKILEALEDDIFSMRVAQKGKELVRDMFDPIIHTKKIIDFCES